MEATEQLKKVWRLLAARACPKELLEGLKEAVLPIKAWEADQDRLKVAKRLADLKAQVAAMEASLVQATVQATPVVEIPITRPKAKKAAV